MWNWLNVNLFAYKNNHQHQSMLCLLLFWFSHEILSNENSLNSLTKFLTYFYGKFSLSLSLLNFSSFLLSCFLSFHSFLLSIHSFNSSSLLRCNFISSHGCILIFSLIIINVYFSGEYDVTQLMSFYANLCYFRFFLHQFFNNHLSFLLYTFVCTCNHLRCEHKSVLWSNVLFFSTVRLWRVCKFSFCGMNFKLNFFFTLFFPSHLSPHYPNDG